MTMLNPVYNFLHNVYLKLLVNENICMGKQSVDLSGLDACSVPERLYDYREVLKIFLNQNMITTIKPRPDRWQQLSTLTLDYNRIAKLPPEIGLLRNLTYLNVGHNPLKKIPPQLGELHNLVTFWCNSTLIEELPEEICNLVNLTTLGARHNKIRFLPKRLGNLKKLSWLTMANNLIEELPEGLSDLKLVHLNMSVNCLTHLPMDINEYKYLQYLIVSSNQINCLPLINNTKWDLSKMESLVYIDLRRNPIIQDTYFKNYFKSYTSLKINYVERPGDIRPQPSAVQDVYDVESLADDNEDNNFDDEAVYNTDDESDSSLDEWEYSVSSVQLNDGEHSDDDLDGNDIPGINIQMISKYTGTGS